jgi:catechol 2,3-dioxygenase-like lactoylglutathione lyase family enzyme
VSKLDLFRRQAKQLVRWHREGDHSVGGRIRILPRYHELTDTAALALRFPLAEAQEVIAKENGYQSWSALKAAVDEGRTSVTSPVQPVDKPLFKRATPIILVSDVQASAIFFRDKLGFRIDFLHGNPPFYASVSRDDARLHLRFVHEAPYVAGVLDREQAICAFVEVDNVKNLYAEYLAAGVDILGRLKKEPWGGLGID